MSFRRLMGGAAIVALASVCAIEAQAQDTSASVRGVVTADGTPVAGATVVLLHTPSGTVKTVTTGAGGVYFASGLRVGGPYSITVGAPGAAGEVLDGVFLDAGNPEPINVSLASQTVETIVITGTATQSIDLNNGVGSAFNARDIANAPSGNRDLTSLIGHDPLVNVRGTGSFSVAGVNPRFNNLALDGVLQKDDMGLGTSVYATARSPISLDTVEAVSISASDYSTTTGGFQGGLVNVVTKSGTNEFDGSLYYYYSSDSFTGSNTGFPGAASHFNFPDFEEKEYGFTLGGPIIQDRLFFFAGYEEFTSSTSANFAAADAQNRVIDTSVFADLQRLIQQAYGFDPGGRPDTASTPRETIRYFGKLDWNINNDHRASFSVNRTEETETVTSALSLTSAWYQTPLETTSYSGQLYSDWTDNFSTTFRVGYKELAREQNCNAGLGVGELRMLLNGSEFNDTSPTAGFTYGTSGKVTAPSDLTILAGCDRFRHINTFADERLQVFGQGDYVWGDHLFSFGAEWQDYYLDNAFSQNSLGRFSFTNLDQLTSRTASEVLYQNVPSNDVSEYLAQWGYNQLALFAQDEWQILPELSVSAGIRYERFIQDDKPPARPDFEAAYGRSNQDTLDGLDLIMPRFGFRYTPFDRTTIKGGLGLFAGGEPIVWVSNAMSPLAPLVTRTSGAAVTNVDPSTVPAILLADVVASTSGPIDTIGPDFEIPSQWKASIGIEQEFDLDFGSFNLGEGYLASATVLFTDTNKGHRWISLAHTLGTPLPQGIAPDGRPILANLDTTGATRDNAVELVNYDDSQSVAYAFSLSNEFDNGLGFYLSYAFQDTESVTPGSSSRGVSNLQAIADVDRNNPGVGIAPYQIEHKFGVNFSYERAFIADLATRFDLSGTIQSGTPFTYNFNVDNTAFLFGKYRGETPLDADPLYIPEVVNGAFSDPTVVFGGTGSGATFSAFNQAAFLDYISDRGIPTGQVFERNTDESSWNQQWDFRFQQELPGVPGVNNWLGDNRFKFTVDIENVANLINDEWGTQTNGPSFNGSGIIVADLVRASDYAGLGPNPTPAQINGLPALSGNTAALQPAANCATQTSCLYRFNSFTPLAASFNDLTNSVYSVRFGLRYEF